MSETEKASENKDTGGNVVVVNQEANNNEVNIEAQKKVDRVDKMDQLKKVKGKVTKSLNKIEPAVQLFEKYENERGTAKRLNAKSKEIQYFFQDWKKNMIKYMK